MTEISRRKKEPRIIPKRRPAFRKCSLATRERIRKFIGLLEELVESDKLDKK